MIKRTFSLFLLVFLISCSPTNWLKLDTLNPSEFTIPDTGKITILNASYLPTVIHEKLNLMSRLPANEQYVFDTLIIANLFNGLFSILNESPSESLRNAEYEEIRTVDTTNFLGPLSGDGITFLTGALNSKYLVCLEYYGFNNKTSSDLFTEDGWTRSLEIPYKLIWRTYNNEGKLLDQYIDSDSLYWYENNYSYTLPELPDAVREVFFLAGERFAKHISPFWSVISREYYLISQAGEDISLDRDKLLLLKDGKRKTLKFKACYNLAILSESEDKLDEAIDWLNKASEIVISPTTENYKKKLIKRQEIRQKIDIQVGNK